MKFNLKEVFSNFQAEGTFNSGIPYGSGHINDTFKVATSESDANNYILQKINHHIFKNVPQLQDNILRVTTHLRKKIEKIPGADPEREILTLIHLLKINLILRIMRGITGGYIFLLKIEATTGLKILLRHSKVAKHLVAFSSCFQIL